MLRAWCLLLGLAALLPVVASADDYPAIRGEGEPFVDRGLSVSVSARAGTRAGTFMDADIEVGGGFGFWPDRHIGVEVLAVAWPLSGVQNVRGVDVASMRLLEASYRLETLDPQFGLTASAVFAPLQVAPAPPGAPRVPFELLLGIGGGFEVRNVEMLAGTSADPGAVVASTVIDVVPVGTALLGGRLALTSWMGLRLDLRLFWWVDQVLDFDEDEAAAINRNLGPMANRTTCDDPNISSGDRACKTAAEAGFSASIGVDFAFGPRTVGGDR